MIAGINIHDPIAKSEDEEIVRDFLDERFNLVYCDDCDEITYRDYSYDSSGETVCRQCIDDHYTYSNWEGEYVHNEVLCDGLDRDGDPVRFREGNESFIWSDHLDTWVHEDYSEPEPELIGNYHSSKRLVKKQFDDWTQQHHRFFGVELEVEAERYRHDAAKRIHECVNTGGDQKLFFENDGSLSNGFEMITHPMSLPAQRELWSFLKDRSVVSDVVSHKSTTCGLHVHVSRDNLTKLQVAKMVAFINAPQNEKFVRAIARRYQSGYCKIKSKKIGESSESQDRYEAVNVTGHRTVEFRLFKGSTRYEAVVAAIEFTNAMVEFSKTATTSIQSLNWKEFLRFCEKEVKSETKFMLPYVESRLAIAA